MAKNKNNSHTALFNSPILCHSTNLNIPDGDFNKFSICH